MKKITIIGLGALGSHAAIALRNTANLTLVDFDIVEQKNTLAQFHTRMGLRRNKAHALQQAMQGMWGIKVETMTHKVSITNIDFVLTGVDLVLDCTDNIAARHCLQNYCKAHNIPLLHSAMSAEGTFAQVCWTDDFEADAEDGDGVTCEDGANLPFHSMVGSCLAANAQAFIEKNQKRSYQITPNGIMRV